MSMRVTNNLLAVLVVIGILVLMVLMSGWTVYKVHSIPGKETKVSVYSSRNFVAPDLNYEREGDNATFSFGAESSIQPGPMDYAAGVADALRLLQADQNRE